MILEHRIYFGNVTTRKTKRINNSLKGVIRILIKLLSMKQTY